MDGDLDRARDLLAPILDAKKLHASEAIALFTTQTQIAIKRREFDSAEQSLEILAQLTGEDDRKVIELRRRIVAASGKSRIRRWLASK